MVAMRSGHDVRKGSEQVDAKSASAPAPTGRDEAQEGLDELLRLRISEQPDTGVHTPARDARAIGDGDRAVLPHAGSLTAPPVPDDVSCPLPVNRPVTRIVTNIGVCEIGLKKVLAEFNRKPDFIFAGQRVT